MRIFALLLIYLCISISCSVDSKIGTDLCPRANDILSDLTSNYKPDKATIEFLDLKEEIYFDKTNCLTVKLWRPTFSAVDLKSISYEEGFKDYAKVKGQIQSEMSPYVNQIVESCNTEKVDKIMIEIGKEGENGKFLHWLTLDYPLNGE